MTISSGIFLIAASFCILMLLVLCSLFRFGVAGTREWCVANAIAFVAFILYALGRELPPWLAYEAANGTYALATAVLLAGFRRFFARKVPWAAIAAGIPAFVVAIAVFHYQFDSFVLRTLSVSLFQIVILLAIAFTVFRSRQAWHARYPYFFTGITSFLLAAGHVVRAIIHAFQSAEVTSLLQPSPLNVFFISAGTFVLPILTFGAMMMVHDRVMAKAESAANRDFLTGAWSRRAFFELLTREMSQWKRTGRKFSLLLLDVDHFKDINDKFGHAAGDQVLVDVALRSVKALRTTDYFGRIGGEEFAVVLPETERDAALAVAERLRASAESTSASHAAGTHASNPACGVCTVSIGLATVRDGDSIAELMQRADDALYAAKRAGRNQVQCEPRLRVV